VCHQAGIKCDGGLSVELRRQLGV